MTYFITLFPYIILTIILGYAATLPGFQNGIQFYMIPDDWSNLGDATVWFAAAAQIFLSLGIGAGAQLLLASFSDFRNNCHRDALLVGFFNSVTSVYAGFAVFGVIGFLAEIKHVPIEDVATDGPGLAFIIYPEALAQVSI